MQVIEDRSSVAYTGQARGFGRPAEVREQPAAPYTPHPPGRPPCPPGRRPVRRGRF